MLFSDRHDSGDELLPKVLFYSVLLHYALLYLFFGNPFLILIQDDVPLNSPQRFEVKLLNFPMNGSDREKAPERLALSHDIARNTETDVIPTTRLSRKEQEENFSESAVDQLEDQHKPAKVLPLVTAKKTSPPMPSNMSGPEDCMLKVVGMVCPQGRVGCIKAYIAFCTSLSR